MKLYLLCIYYTHIQYVEKNYKVLYVGLDSSPWISWTLCVIYPVICIGKYDCLKTTTKKNVEGHRTHDSCQTFQYSYCNHNSKLQNLLIKFYFILKKLKIILNNIIML